MTKRDIAVDLLKKYVGLPYKWGGNDAMEGFDCSGLMVEILQSTGLMPSNSDATAHDLSKKYPETDVLLAGTLVFWDWNKDGRIDHVEMIAFTDEDGEVFTIGASGGGSATTTEAAARADNAFIKVRPLREGYIMAVDPYLTTE